jgi:predicted nucleotidyltransferase
MAVEEYSFRHRFPTFLISAGTQVVLKVSKSLPDGTVRLPGSVAVVVESPSDNHYAYTVRFADGQTVPAFFHELAIRRKEIDDQLALTDEDLRPWIIYRCQVGSHAYGLATEDSDADLRGIYLPPARWHWSIWKLPEQLEYADETKDEVYWELEKFLRLALKANPNVLETLWTPCVLHADVVAQRLRDIRDAFLSRHLYQTYSGYVLSQFRHMAKAHTRTGTYKFKHAMHLIRLLYSGIEVLRSGQIRIDVSEHREELLAIKAGRFSFEEVQQKALALDQQFQAAYQQTRLPEQPDYQRVNEFLIWARRRMVDA